MHHLRNNGMHDCAELRGVVEKGNKNATKVSDYLHCEGLKFGAQILGTKFK